MPLLTDSNIDFWFKQYRSQYDRSKNYAERQGGEVRDIPPLSRKEFEIDFRSEVEDNPGLSGTKIAQKMAKDDVYPHSFKQARAAAKAIAEKEGRDITAEDIRNIRTNATDFWGNLSSFNNELKNAGLNSKERKLKISQEFFGSP